MLSYLISYMTLSSSEIVAELYFSAFSFSLFKDLMLRPALGPALFAGGTKLTIIPLDILEALLFFLSFLKRA